MIQDAQRKNSKFLLFLVFKRGLQRERERERERERVKYWDRVLKKSLKKYHMVQDARGKRNLSFISIKD